LKTDDLFSAAYISMHFSLKISQLQSQQSIDFPENERLEIHSLTFKDT